MRLNIVIALFLASLTAGCTTVTEAGYYWGDYAPTLYKYTKSPSDETMAEHRESLEGIIAKSTEKDLRVPPGVYAELGYLQQQLGDREASLNYYASEIKLYPESAPFLERLMNAGNENGEAQ